MAKLDQQTDKSRGAFAALILGKGLSVAADGVKKLISNDRKKFTAGYATGVADLYFYRNISLLGALDPTGMQFNGFNVLRHARMKQSALPDTALYVAFEVDTSNPYELLNNSIFRLRLKEFKLKNAKAKVPDKKWFFPWTYGYQKKKKIQMDIEIVVRASWFSEMGNFFDKVQIGRFLLSIRDLPLDWNDQRQFIEPLKGTPVEGYSLLVPRSYGFLSQGSGELEPCYGQGHYDIGIQVKESTKETFITKMFFDNSDELLNQVKKINK